MVQERYCLDVDLSTVCFSYNRLGNVTRSSDDPNTTRILVVRKSLTKVTHSNEEKKIPLLIVILFISLNSFQCVGRRCNPKLGTKRVILQVPERRNRHKGTICPERERDTDHLLGLVSTT